MLDLSTLRPLNKVEQSTIDEIGNEAAKKVAENPLMDVLPYNHDRYPYQHPDVAVNPQSNTLHYVDMNGREGTQTINIDQIKAWGQAANPAFSDEMLGNWLSSQNESLLDKVVADVLAGKVYSFVGNHFDFRDLALGVGSFLVAVRNRCGEAKADEIRTRTAMITGKLVTRLNVAMPLIVLDEEDNDETVNDKVELIRAPSAQQLATGGTVFFSVPRTENVRNSGIDERTQDTMNKKLGRAFIEFTRRKKPGGTILFCNPSGSVDLKKYSDDGKTLVGITMQPAAPALATFLRDEVIPLGYAPADNSDGIQLIVGKPRENGVNNGKELDDTMEQNARNIESRTRISVTYKRNTP